MPNRILRDWTDSEKIEELDVYAERFLTRLIMKVDDFGRHSANVKLLKSHLFPLKSDIRETDITRWLTACEKPGLIVLYNVANKDYLQIENFKQTLRQKNEKYPPPVKCIADAQHVHSIGMPETKGNESELETNRAKALVATGNVKDLQRELKKEYEKLIEELKEKDKITIWNSLKEFLLKRPHFPEPVVDVWNLFAANYNFAEAKSINNSRRRKYATRIQETEFDFIKILEKIKRSSHLKGDNQNNWKVTFDWILENDKNYLKILEGNYD